MVKHHAEYAETTDFVQGVDSHFWVQYTTLFKKILKDMGKCINIYIIIKKENIQYYHKRR